MDSKVYRADLEDFEIIGSAFNLYRIFYNQQPDADEAKKYIKERLRNNESIIFFIKIESQCAGFTQLYPTFDSVRLRKKIILYDLFVREEHRRLGIGKKLMNEAKEFAKSNGYGSIELTTGIKNISGQSLYESLGYIKDDQFFSYDLEI